MGIEIDIACPDRSFMGYLAMPEHKVGPGIVLLHDKFGIDHVLRSKADYLSQKLNMFVLIPDLYWRSQPCLTLNSNSPDDEKKANRLAESFNLETGATDSIDTVLALREIGGCTGRVGVLGYGLGAQLAYLASTRSDVNASVAYYPPVLDQQHLSEAIRITNPLLLHFPENLGREDQEKQIRIRSSLKDYFMVTSHTYPEAKPGFARPGAPSFSPENAALADKRSEEFLAANLAF